MYIALICKKCNHRFDIGFDDENQIYDLNCPKCNQRIYKDEYILEFQEKLYNFSKHLSNSELLSITVGKPNYYILQDFNELDKLILNCTDKQKKLITSSIDFLYLIVNSAVKSNNNQKLISLKETIFSFWKNNI